MNQISNLSSPPAALGDLTPTANKYAGNLVGWAAGHGHELIASDAVAKIRAELAHVLDRRSPVQVAAKWGAKLMACYPARASDNSDDLRAYASVIVEELARFAPEVLEKVLPEFWRSHPFRPSVAELSMALEAEVERFYRLKHGLRRMDAKRAEIEARARAEEERKAEERQRAVAVDALAVERLGAAGVIAGDYWAAMRTFDLCGVNDYGWRRPAWRRIVQPDQDWPAWVGPLMARAGMFGRVHLAMTQGRAQMAELAEAHRLLVAQDPAAARRLVNEIDQRRVEANDAPEREYYPVGRVPPEVAELLAEFRTDFVRHTTPAPVEGEAA